MHQHEACTPPLRRRWRAIAGLALAGLAAAALAAPGTPLPAHWSLDETGGKSATERHAGRADPVSYVFNEARFKPASPPLWRTGGCVLAGCLLFDGYSTRIEAPGLTIAQASGGFTLSAWVAPHAFEWGDGGHYSAFLSQFDGAAKQGFSFGVFRFGTWGIKLGLGSEILDVRVTARKLPRDAWSHVAASYDPATRKVALFLDGERVAEAGVPAGANFALPVKPLTIGRHSEPERIGGVFSLNTFLGLMDEVRIDAAPSDAAAVARTIAADVARHGGKPPRLAPADLRIAPSTFAGDRHRPRYHAMPDAGWMNEPHAPFHHAGQYHLFFQKNPFGPFWHQIHWGHWVSPDMVHWRELPIALAPEDDGLATDGIWSGSATHAADGSPVLFFTAGNDSARPNQRTGMATPRDPADADFVGWKKHPVPVTVQKQGEGHFGDFRDPFVFRDGTRQRWFQLVASKLPGGSGTALVYESADLRNWTPRGPLFSIDAARFPGFDATWELPVLLPVGKGRDGRERHVFLNDVRAQAYYWIGVFDPETARFTPDLEAPRVFDVGQGHFSGPSGFVDPKTGRTIVFSIAQGERTLRDEYDAGWAHNGGLPVALSLGGDGDLRLAPIEELASLRRRQLVNLTDASVAEAERALAAVRGDALEIELELAPSPKAGRRGLGVRVAPGGAERTDLYVDTARSRLEIDRTRTSRDRSYGVQGGAFDLAGEPLRLRVFLDRSMVEAYANERRSLTSRTYTSRADADGLALLALPGDRVRALRVWTMGSIDKEN
ncbi:GH32 C-terminal domain-containing protein [Pseudoduganella umbonata]|uniref:beta-fructofuranosidase n=1 Tax=Pseudoduganella umbonata TaxID=864828 RepID=A0A4P8HPE3_9BURK|nr:GH32 C-terminal domain-containing protein [Pseudoduganella umbonata]MBB3221192.1 sucrose-6-phosphate hydrolase SacC (GH32 family) [Pseudoduganella umbonata]QCP10382.1 glycoside hydrolase [Pseudoduganella umbonata]